MSLFAKRFALVAGTLLVLGCKRDADPAALLSSAAGAVDEPLTGPAAQLVGELLVGGVHAAPLAEQQRGLMFRTGIPADGGMLFAPYPAGGGGPKEASFWMKDTPSPLDIIFIRTDGTIAHIAENTVPFSEAQVKSGEPVAAVLEINGGRSAELGISVGDKVSWK